LLLQVGNSRLALGQGIAQMVEVELIPDQDL
jgi:Fe2+ transport system protein FeoA